MSENVCVKTVTDCRLKPWDEWSWRLYDCCPGLYILGWVGVFMSLWSPVSTTLLKCKFGKGQLANPSVVWIRKFIIQLHTLWLNLTSLSLVSRLNDLQTSNSSLMLGFFLLKWVRVLWSVLWPCSYVRLLRLITSNWACMVWIPSCHLPPLSAGIMECRSKCLCWLFQFWGFSLPPLSQM